MTRCDNCPVFYAGGELICGITSDKLISGNDYSYYQNDDDCPLKKIELKDGFVYTPETVNDDM